MANDLFPVATYRPALRTTPNPRPKADPAPIAPDPAANGVTWYTLQDGSMIPGEGTYVDIVAQNIEEIIICANNIDSIIQAVDANVQAQDAANRAAASATAAANSASAANGSASLASASASAAQTSATNAATSASNAATSASGASGSATAAANSATASSNSATNAANSAANAAASYNTFHNTWYGPYASPPALDPAGLNPTQGDLYFDTTLQAVQVYNGTSWQAIASGVTSVAGKSGVVTLFHNDISDWNASLAPYATLASPVFTGTPSLPAGAVAVTAAPGDNDNSVATTAFVTNATGGIAGFAPLASPVFTGNPTAPTPAPGDADTSIATTAFVTTALVPYAPLASPVFTGDARAVTPAVGDNDTSIATTAFVQTATQAAIAGNVGRNLIHNGMFNVQQRGTGPWTTNGAYTADRWIIGVNTDTVSFSMSTINDAGRTAIGDEAASVCLANTFTGNAAAGALNYYSERIEDVRRLAGKTVTVSFYAVCLAGTLKLGINLVQVFGSGGSPSASVVVLPTGNAVTITTTWARYSTTIAVPSVAGKTFGTNTGTDYTNFQIWCSCGSTNSAQSGNIGVQSGTVQLWGVQLEVAQPGQTQPTPLAKRDQADELALCQRFYQVGDGSFASYQVTGSTFQVSQSLPVTMRGGPTIALINQSNSNLGALSTQVNTTRITIWGAASANGGSQIITGYNLSADL